MEKKLTCESSIKKIQIDSQCNSRTNIYAYTFQVGMWRHHVYIVSSTSQ